MIIFRLINFGRDSTYVERCAISEKYIFFSIVKTLIPKNLLTCLLTYLLVYKLLEKNSFVIIDQISLSITKLVTNFKIILQVFLSLGNIWQRISKVPRWRYWEKNFFPSSTWLSILYKAIFIVLHFYSILVFFYSVYLIFLLNLNKKSLI